MKKILSLLCLFLAFASCGHDSDSSNEEAPSSPFEVRGPFERTVLVYASGENNLNSFLDDELQEMREGSKGIGNNALVVFVDDANKQRTPYLLWFKEGEIVDSVKLDCDPYSSDPQLMSYILKHTSTYYPAKEYGLVLWGHSSGWVIEDSVTVTSSDSATFIPSQHRAYGIDNGRDNELLSGKWMNISTLGNVIRQWNHVKFIFADCCQFQCVESAYELKDVTDYIIGSPAEVPGEGAPYNTITKGFFEPSETFYQTIADRYFEQTFAYQTNPSMDLPEGYLHTPISVIRTANLPQLAEATNIVLHSFLPLNDTPYPDMSRIIYYRGNTEFKSQNTMYDMNDFILKYADQLAYAQWKEAFDNVVVYRRYSKAGWLTERQVSSTVFKWLDDERFGGISMFVPQDRPNAWYAPYMSNGVRLNGYNADIKNMAWYRAARLSEFGW
jgi:hypothetical protein